MIDPLILQQLVAAGHITDPSVLQMLSGTVTSSPSLAERAFQTSASVQGAPPNVAGFPKYGEFNKGVDLPAPSGELQPPAQPPPSVAPPEGLALQMGTPAPTSGPNFGGVNSYMQQYQALGSEIKRTQEGKRAKIEQAGADISQIYNRIHQEDLQRTEVRKSAEDEAGQKLSEVSLLARYGNASMEEIKYHQGIISDPDGSPEAKEQSRIALAKAEEIQPGRFWSSRAGWQKALAVIGIAIGESNRMKYGMKENVAMDIINQAIEQDIVAQRDKFAKRGRAVGEAQTYYEMAMKKLDREDERTQATRVLMRQEVQDNIGIMNSLAENDQSKLSLMQNMALNGAKLEQDKQQFMEMVRHNRELERANMMKMELDAAKAEKTARISQTWLRDIAGTKSMIVEMQGLQDEFNQLGASAMIPGASHVWGTDARAFRRKVEKIIPAFGKSIEQRLTEGDYNRYKSMFPEGLVPESIGTKEFQDLIDRMQHKIEQDEQLLRMQGYNTSGILTPSTGPVWGAP